MWQAQQLGDREMSQDLRGMQGYGNPEFQDEKSDEKAQPPPYYSPPAPGPQYQPYQPPTYPQCQPPVYPPYQPPNYPPYQPTTSGLGLQQPLVCQPMTNVTVVNTQATVMAHRPVYKDYMCWSILNMFCCCLPLGIVALIFSCKARSDIDSHDDAAAARSSRAAYSLNIAALLIGIVLNIVVILYYTGTIRF